MSGEAWLVLLGLAGAYAVHIALWPMRKCWACSGKGKLRAPLSRAWRDCDACGGAGERPRWWLFRGR
ncbi:MAG: hypothetical protein ACRCZP_15700 [Phycicoccus sp.]